jgi:hypothetical protein
MPFQGFAETLCSARSKNKRENHAPHLLVPPVVRERDMRPAHLHNGGRRNGRKEDEEVDERRGADLGRHKLVEEEAHRGQHAVDHERDRRERVDGRVDVSKPLRALQAPPASAVAVPDGVVAGEEDFHGAEAPAEHLVQTIGHVDGGGTLQREGEVLGSGP